MKTTFADERGRITLGAKILHKYGKRFAVVSAGNEIVLVPIAKDPVAKLAQIGKQAGIDRYTLKELKKMAKQEAKKEALGNVR